MVVEMAHDFRSPLSCILMLTESLLDGRSGSLTALQQRQLRLVYGAALGLSVTTSNVMELARDEGTLTREAPERLSLGTIVLDVRNLIEPMAREQNLTLFIELPSDDHERLGLPRAITSILITMALRAVRATEAGSIAVAVHVDGDDLSLVTFSVTDSGPMIAPERITRLFEPFAPPDAEKPYDFSPTGLGLFVCRRLLAEMGSGLAIESDTTEGTRFSFTLSLPPVPRRT
jgi:signal transduction histidine kinase